MTKEVNSTINLTKEEIAARDTSSVPVATGQPVAEAEAQVSSEK